MADQGPKHTDAAEAAIKAALESVERLERERAASNDDDIDPDEVEVLPSSGAPPSAGDLARTGSGEEEAVEIIDDVAEARAEIKASPGDAILNAMIKAKNEAIHALEQTQKEALSLKERLMRVSAEFENFKKRQAREKEDAIKFANESLLKELMPVLDNMDRAVSSSRQSVEAKGHDEQTIKTLIDGVEMVLRQFVDTMGRFGVEPFSAAGKPFDPSMQEAVGTREDSSVPNNTVIEEYQRGYTLNGRLVRPAMVVVSHGGPSPSREGTPENDG